jgi:hypothetical protein
LKGLVREFEELGNDKGTIGFSNARLAYDDVLARLVFFLEIGNFGIKGTETRISERFRERTGFPDDALNRARHSIDLFSKARETRDAWRFNKANLLSWLLFYSRFQFEEPNKSFLGAFLDCATETQLAGSSVPKALSVFQDRASLRVTDVSSVMLRDFALWYGYYFLVNQQVPDPIPERTILDVRYALEHSTPNFEQAVVSLVAPEEWGQLL